MGIDISRLLKNNQQKAEPKDQIDSLLNEVFREDAGIDVAGKEKEQPLPASGSIGKMLYNGQEVEVSGEVDADGNAFIKDDKGVLQVKASDLKPLPGVVGEAVVTKEPEKPKKRGFWDSYFGDMLERMGAGASMFSGGMYSLFEKIDKYTNPYRYFYPEKKGWFEEQAEAAYSYAQTLRERSDRYKGKNYKDFWREGDYSGLFGEVFLTASESFPQSLVAAMGGTAGLALTGVSTGVQRYDELDRMPETKDLPEYTKALNAVAYGTFEAMFEKLGDQLVGETLKKIYRLAPPKKLEERVKDEISTWMEKQFKRYGLLWMPVSEGIEEVSTQIADNVTDYATGVTDEWNPTEGCWDSFVYGAAGGMQFSAIGAPGAVINWHNKTSAKRDYKKAKEQFREAFQGNEGNEEVETFMDGLTFMSPAEQEATLGSLARGGEYSDQQIEAAANLANRAKRYREYYRPEMKAKEKEAWKETVIQTELRDFKNQISPLKGENGMIQEVFLDGNEEAVVYVVKGDVGVQEEGGKLVVDVSQCSPELYYRDSNGDVQVTTPEHVTGVHAIRSEEELLNGYEKHVREAYEKLQGGMSSESEATPEGVVSPSSPTYENGDHVNYTDEEGKIAEGVIADAFSNHEFVFLDNGTVVPREKIISVREDEEVSDGNGAEVISGEGAPEETVSGEVRQGTETKTKSEKKKSGGRKEKNVSDVNVQERRTNEGENVVAEEVAESNERESVPVEEFLQETQPEEEAEAVPGESQYETEMAETAAVETEGTETEIEEGEFSDGGTIEEVRNPEEDGEEVRNEVEAEEVETEETGTEKAELPAEGKQDVKPGEKEGVKDFGANNQVITLDKYEELKRRWKEKTSGQLNAGFDPELLSIGVQMAMFHLEAGARKFGDFAKSIVGDIGESIVPYLKSIYEGARYAPGMEKVAKDMDNSGFIANFKVEELFASEGRETGLSSEVRATCESKIMLLESEIKERESLIKNAGNDISTIHILEEQIAERRKILREYQKILDRKVEQEVNEDIASLKRSSKSKIKPENSQKQSVREVDGDMKFPVKSYPIEGIDHEQPNVSIEKEVNRDVQKFVKELQAFMGWDFDKGKSGKREVCFSNIAPIGGFSTFILWKPGTDAGIYASVEYVGKDGVYEPKERLLWRVTTKEDKFKGLTNQYCPIDADVKGLASLFEKAVEKYIGNSEEKSEVNKGDERKHVTGEFLEPKTDVSAGEFANKVERSINRSKSKDDVRGYEDRSVSDTGSGDAGKLDDRAHADGDVSDVSERRVEGVFEGESGHGNGRKGSHPEQRGDAGGSNGDGDGDVVKSSEGRQGVSDASDEQAGGGNRDVSGHSASVLERNSRNYHIRDPATMVVRGEISKIKANIRAIRLLKRLEREGRTATEEEQEILAKFCGWGGLAEVLNTEKFSVSSWREKYEAYHKQIKELLTPEEFTSVVNSTINAHYTSGTVVTALWELAERLGFRGGKVLEPAAGIGNFLGLMPPHLSAASDIRAYELDSITGRLLSYLYPDAGVKVAGYETSKDRGFSLIITNVPFGQSAPYDSVHKDLSKFSLHNYFIAKGITQLKPGGLGIFITSSSTLDSGASVKFREWVTKEGNADLIGAIRLPNNAFLENAGTEVTTDVLVFLKRDGERSSSLAQSFRYALPYKDAIKKDGTPTTIDVNEYYVQHPEFMLGEPVLAYTTNKGGLYSHDDVTLEPHKGVDLKTALKDAIGRFDTKVLNVEEELAIETVLASEDDKEGALVLRDGEVRIVDGGELVSPEWINDYTTDSHRRKVSKKEIAKEYLSIRSVADDLVKAEIHNDVNIEELRARLNREYGNFVKRFGRFSRNLKLRFLAESDVNYNSVFALEQVETKFVKDDKGNVKKEYYITNSDIFTKRVSFPFSEPTVASSLPDGLSVSLAYRGKIDLEYIAQLVNGTKESVKEELLAEGFAYINPSTGLLEDKDSYLSGAVRRKYAEAVAAAESDPAFERNVRDLKAVIPDDLAPSQISFRLGTPFIPASYIESFVKEKLGVTASIKYNSTLNRWFVEGVRGATNPQNTTVFGTKRIHGIQLLEKGLNLQQPVIYDTNVVEGKKIQTKNLEATADAQNKLNEIADAFIGYIRDNDEFMRNIAHLYNEQYNGQVEKKYSEPPFKHFPGANKEVTLRIHQKKAVARCLQDSTLLWHQVGTGKTYTMITAAMEMRRLGIAKKPMLAVQNSTVEQFVASFKHLYPAAKILSPTKSQMDAKNRVRLFNLISYGDWDAIVVPQSFLSKIPDDPNRLKAYINEQISELEGLLTEVDPNEEKSLHAQLKAQLGDLKERLEKVEDEEKSDAEQEEGGKPKRVKDKARKQLGIVKRFTRQADRRVDHVRTFEELGVDALYVDEAHNYKRLGLITKLANVRGIDTSGSQRAFSVLMKVRYIQEESGGRNVVFATGTPVSNTMAEVWTMLKYIAPDVLESYCMRHFDEFASTFGSVEPSLEFTSTGSFKVIDRFKSYVNVPELIQALRAKIDVVLTEDIPEFKCSNTIPKLKDGHFTQKIIPQSKALQGVMGELKKKIQDWEDLPPREKRMHSAVPLLVFKEARQAAIDLRLLDPSFADDPNSKTNAVVKEVLRIYRETNDFKGTQLIFSDLYQSSSKIPGKRFNLYEELKRKLVEGGIPEQEVAIVNDYGDSQRELLFTQVQTGEVRVLIGGTEKMGVGVNVQDRLAALHHIDAPSRPMDFEQRNGRILRQGNLLVEMGIPVEVLLYGVERTLDATAYQRLAIKQSFINQLIKNENVGREIEDAAAEDSVTDMSFQEMMSTLSGSQYAILHTQRLYALRKLEMAKDTYERRQIELNRDLENCFRLLEMYKGSEKELLAYKANIEKYFPEGKVTSVKIEGKVYSEKIGEKLGTALEAYEKLCKKKGLILPFRFYLNEHPTPVDVRLEGLSYHSLFNYDFRSDGSKESISGVEIQTGQGMLASINSALNIKSMNRRFEDFYSRKKLVEDKIPVFKEEMKKPFAKEEELKAVAREVEELEKKMQEEVIDGIKDAGNADEEVVSPESAPEGQTEEETRFREEAVSWRARRREEIRKEVARLEQELKVNIEVVRSRTDLPLKEQERMSPERRYPGLFVPKTGKVYVVLEEVVDRNDLRKTVYHEFVGHKGLRALLGDESEGFYREVLKSMDGDKRDVFLSRYHGDRLLAAEEYVASFAEGYREPSAWLKVKGIWNRVLRKLGIELKLSDTDLKFMLWRAKNRLKESDSVLEQLGKVVKGYGLHRELEKEDLTWEGVSELEFDDADKLKFHNEVVSSKFQFVEAYQDRMLAVKRFQELVELNTGSELPDYMNVYRFENTLASRNKYEMEFFRNNYIRPLTKAIANLEKEGLTRREIENYVLLKHGLERNVYLRNKKVEEALAPLSAKIERMEKNDSLLMEDGTESYEELLKMAEELRESMEKKYAKVDFAGVSVVSEEVVNKDAEGFIQGIEERYGAGVDALWGAIKQATDFSLKKWYESGMIDRNAYGRIRKMFRWYVPLRGFDETIADDVYEYFGEHESAFTSPLRRMNGRRSRADNPFAYIASQAESAIVGGNKNLMKLHLFRLAQKYPSSFMSVSKVWYEQTGEDEEGKAVYEAAIPAYDDRAEVYRDNIEAFNKRMRKLEAEGKAKRSFQHLEVGLRTLGNEASEHVVRVRLNGEEFAILVHGDPRIAQAVNGLNDQERAENKVIRAIQHMNRQLAANFTTRNPAFVVSNMCRDMIYSISTLSVKEGTRYRNCFFRNIPKANGAIMRYLRGKADMSDATDRLFEEFLSNGGETGYTALYHVEKYKRMIDAEVRNTRRGKVEKGVLSVFDFFESGNRWAEDLSRFATYVTSRQMGRSVLRSVSDAKEVTVNFNRKGSGAKGAQMFKSLYLFFNAAVQSLANFSEMFRKNPKGASVMVGSYAAIGFLMPLLLMGLGGDDALEEYLNLPDYVRKNNVCVWLGKKHGFITLPLPIELRAFNGLGDCAFRFLSGEIDGVTASEEVVTGFADLLPLNPAGGGTPFVPDAMKPMVESFYTNEDFTGRPVAKVNPFNRYEPEYKKVYRGTGEFFVKSSEVLNSVTGGDYATRGYLDKAGGVVSDVLGMDVNVSNPAAWEHLFEAYLGGMYTTFTQSLKVVAEGVKKVVGGEAHVEARNIPIGNRFYYQGGIWGARAKVNARYYQALEECREMEFRMRKYKEALYNGGMSMEEILERYAKMVKDGQDERMKVVKYYSREIDRLNQALRNEVLTEDEGEELEEEILLLKKQMLEELEEVKKKRHKTSSPAD